MNMTLLEVHVATWIDSDDLQVNKLHAHVMIKKKGAKTS